MITSTTRFDDLGETEYTRSKVENQNANPESSLCDIPFYNLGQNFEEAAFIRQLPPTFKHALKFLVLSETLF